MIALTPQAARQLIDMKMADEPMKVQREYRCIATMEDLRACSAFLETEGLVEVDAPWKISDKGRAALAAHLADQVKP